MKMSISTKVIATNGLVIVPLLVALSVFVTNSFEQYTLQSVRDSLINQSYTAQLRVSRNLSQLETVFGADLFLMNQELSKGLGVRTQLYYVDEIQNVFVDSDSAHILYDFLPTNDEGVVLALQEQKSYMVRDHEGYRRFVVDFPIYQVNRLSGAGRIVYELDEEYQRLSRLERIFLIFNSGVVIAVVLLLIVVTNWIVSPVKRLKDRITQFDVEGDSPIRADHGGLEDEVHDLAHAFNDMADNIRDLVARLKEEQRKQKRFFDSMTHEIRTPLTTILGYAELLERVEDRDKRGQCMGHIRQEAERLLRLVNELLEQSYLSVYEMKLQLRPENLSALVADTVELLEDRLRKNQVALVLSCDQPVWVRADGDRITELVLNLLDNALKHSGTSRIDVSCYVKENTAVLEIRDYGRGISPAQLDAARLCLNTQGGSMRAQAAAPPGPIHHSQGAGLGLSICRQVVEGHGGHLQIGSDASGTRIIVHLKRLDG